MPSMRSPVHRLVSTLLGVVLASAPVVPAVAHAHAPEKMPGAEAAQAKRINADAQARFAEGNYAEAARLYTRIFEVLPENRVNREERDNTLLISLEVYREAFRQTRSGSDKKILREAATFLCQGRELYAKYSARYREVHGGGAEPSLEAIESNNELETMIGEVDTSLGSPACEAPPPERPKVATTKPQPKLTPIDVPRGPSGVGLIIAGSITLAVGLGTIALIVVGAKQNKEAGRDREDAMTDAENQAADDKGRRGNALLISGSILTGVLVAAGATMLGIGIRRRMRYLALSPQWDRGYVGVSLRGRF